MRVFLLRKSRNSNIIKKVYQGRGRSYAIQFYIFFNFFSGSSTYLFYNSKKNPCGMVIGDQQLFLSVSEPWPLSFFATLNLYDLSDGTLSGYIIRKKRTFEEETNTIWQNDSVLLSYN